jgi:hypothetical protein
LKKKAYLTNERLKYKFKSFFDLSNYGIKVAREKILRGQSVTLNEMIEELVKLPDQVAKNV